MSAPLVELISAQALGSLLLDGRPERPADWSAPEVAEPGTHVRTREGLRVEMTTTDFADHGALLWRTTVSFSGAEAPLIADLRPLDVELPLAGDAVVSSVSGSRCRLDDFMPWEQRLQDGDTRHVEPVGGRSSDAAVPFFVVDLGGSSIAVAIGWSGQWAFDVTRTGSTVRIQAGQAGTRLRLREGETITLPSILTVTVEGDAEEAANGLRRHLEQHVIPHHPDGSVVTPIAHMTMSSFHRSHSTSEAAELEAVARTADLGLEAFWVDACWYGGSPSWAEEVGNWQVRTADFPRGLRPISDAAHDRGLDFIFWMEPERARRASRIVAEHPDLFLTFPDQATDLLLDLGQPRARELALDLISGYVTEFAADVYRQDFNIAPLAAWRAADEPDRAGLHEIRHVEGLYWLWDQLRERHPGLVIDNCASGGRRIDLETMSRSVPLWRSDAADVGGGAEGDDVSLANQRQVAGLGRFVTQHTGPIWAFDPYSTRSALGTGFVVYCPLPTEVDDVSDLRAAVAEVQRLRPLVTGDLHVLTPESAADGWSILQFHQPRLDAGFLVVLRRPGTGGSTPEIRPAAVEADADYRVTMSSGYEQGAEQVLSGAKLAALCLTVDSAPGSLLVEYARLA